MAAGLTDHIWTIEELLIARSLSSRDSFTVDRLPVQK